jgi:hypothetical protein
MAMSCAAYGGTQQLNASGIGSGLAVNRLTCTAASAGAAASHQHELDRLQQHQQHQQNGFT